MSPSLRAIMRPVTSLRVARAAANLLHRPPGGTPESIVRRLLAVQSQDIIQGRRALRARGAGFTAADVNEAIASDRSIVVAWFNRGTLFMVAREDYAWLLGLTAPPRFTGTWTRLRQHGIDEAAAERGLTAMRRVLADRGPVARRELRAALGEAGIRVEGQAFVHQLGLAALRGLVVVGPLVEGRQGVALTRDWLGEEPALPLEGDARDRALAELARRYLLGHGPASDRDLAWWAGLPLRDARKGLGAVKPPAPADAPDRIPLRLLPQWDAYLLGWQERGFLIAEGHSKRVFNEGMVGPAVTVGGRVVGSWGAPKRNGKLAPRVDAFGRVPKRELQAELADLARFEGVELE